MAIFEKVSKYVDADIAMPVRKTAQSAGYDMVAAEDYIIPSFWYMFNEAKDMWPVQDDEFVTTDLMAKFTKQTGFKPTLVSTGMKCKLDSGSWLQLSVRSSSPLKYWLMMGNGIGVIDADYYTILIMREIFSSRFTIYLHLTFKLKREKLLVRPLFFPMA